MAKVLTSGAQFQRVFLGTLLALVIIRPLVARFMPTTTATTA